jgi:adenylyl-sulfate kinase
MLRHVGTVVWFTGLPGAGKTTVAALVADDLAARGLEVSHLDGDRVRTSLTRDLGFTKTDRDANVARVAWAAAEASAAGAVVVVSMISPYAAARAQARSTAEAVGRFVEVHVATPLDECIRRDPKGLYARALAGEIQDFTGVSAPYERPENPELRLDTTAAEPAESTEAVLALLQRLGVV